MLPISVCLIAKNEENCIAQCLESLSAYFDEIILADTGSTDQTLEIASRYTDNIFQFPWCDDFSAARNFAISKAAFPFVLNVDCDEQLISGLSKEEMEAFLLPYLDRALEIGRIEIQNPTLTSAGKQVAKEYVGRFFHRDFFHYEGAIHEQVVAKSVPATVALPKADSSHAARSQVQQACPYYTLPLTFWHRGYENADILKEKTSRNLSLLQTELKEKGENPYTLFQIGQCYYALRQYDRALTYYSKGLTFDVDPHLEYVQTMVTSYGYCLINTKQYQEALCLEGVYEEFSVTADFLFLMGLIYMNNGLLPQAVAEFKKAAATSAHTVEGVNSYLAYYNIAVIYQCQGNPDKAKAYYIKCGDYAPALKQLHALEV